MAKITNDIGYIKAGLDENKQQHKDILRLLKEWKAEAESKFANKWVETIIKFILGIVITSIIGAVMLLIIK